MIEISLLPELTVFHILSFLDSKTITVKFGIACRYFYQFSESKRLWYDLFQNHFPFPELFEEFDIKKDWKSIYKQHRYPATGRYCNFGQFLSGKFERENSKYKYIYHLKEEEKLTKEKDIIFHGGTPGKNVIFGFKRGNLVIFSQTFEHNFVVAGISRFSSYDIMHGAWHSLSYDSGLFISKRNNNFKFIDHKRINDQELEKLDQIFEEHKIKQEKEDYGLTDGQYIGIAYLSPKKEKKILEWKLKKKFHENIGYIITGSETYEKYYITGILYQDICSLIFKNNSHSFHVCLFLKNGKNSFQGIWHTLLNYDVEHTKELFSHQFPEKQHFECNKKINQ